METVFFRYFGAMVVAVAFLIVGGWRWLQTDKHFGPWHRWLLLSLGGLFMYEIIYRH